MIGNIKTLMWGHCNNNAISVLQMTKSPVRKCALFQIMACQLFGAKALPKPMMTYCQLNPKEQTSVKFEPKYEVFHSWKRICKDLLRNGWHFVQGGGWVNISIEGCDISMFFLVIVRNGCSTSVCDFHSVTHLSCDKMAVVLHMIFSNVFLE